MHGNQPGDPGLTRPRRLSSLLNASYGADDKARCLEAIAFGSVVQVNGNYLKLKAGYLFPEMGGRGKAFGAANPDAALIRLGIGDVTEPLPLACREAMKKAIDMKYITIETYV